MKKTILLVEDNKYFNEIIKKFLESNNYNVLNVFNASEALKTHNKSVDLIVLDLMLPDKNGDEIINDLKEIHNVPIIMTSADSTSERELLRLGAAAFVTKPLNNEHFLSLLKSYLK